MFWSFPEVSLEILVLFTCHPFGHLCNCVRAQCMSVLFSSSLCLIFLLLRLHFNLSVLSNHVFAVCPYWFMFLLFPLLLLSLLSSFTSSPVTYLQCLDSRKSSTVTWVVSSRLRWSRLSPTTGRATWRHRSWQQDSITQPWTPPPPNLKNW